MSSGVKIDFLDRKILDALLKNARIPFLEIARRCRVSGAAVHQRVKQLSESGVIKGSQFVISPKGMGYHTCAFIGIQVQLHNPKSHLNVFEKIRKVPEIVECHHISGRYSLLIKVYTRDNAHLKDIIIEKIQSIPEVTATETFISLQEGFTRQLPPASAY
jgi:Lrp/AsnC family transcriptional regulator, regulator for asnA, asnC and gidA